MILRIKLIFGLIATSSVHVSSQKTVEIRREYNEVDTSYTETIKTTDDDGGIKLRNCTEGSTALQNLTDGIRCLSDTNIRNKISGCKFSFKNFNESSNTLPGNTFEVGVFKQDGPISWKEKDISCLNFGHKDGRYVVESNCTEQNSYSGLLLKIGYKVANDPIIGCVVFTAPGLVSENNIEEIIREQITPKPATTVKQATAVTRNRNNGTTTVNLSTTPSSTENNTIVGQPSTTSRIVETTPTATVVPPVVITPTTDNDSRGGGAVLPDTPISNKNKESDGITLKIILPICILVSAIIVVAILLLIFCRKRICRCNHGKKEAIALLEINSGEDIDEEEGTGVLYAVPDKRNKQKKRSREDSTEPSSIVPVWSGYDEVGALIEGAYEARDSINFDDPASKYGVSAMLLKDDKAVVNLNKPENPYEQLGRCNSFTPKTRTEKSKYQKQREEKANQEAQDNADLKITTDTTNQNKNTDSKDPQLQKYSPTMPMSSFKPGSSMRRKQDRTSMKKPNGTKKDSSASLTHEVVSITPQSSKKYKIDENDKNNQTSSQKDLVTKSEIDNKEKLSGDSFNEENATVPGDSPPDTSDSSPDSSNSSPVDKTLVSTEYQDDEPRVPVDFPSDDAPLVSDNSPPDDQISAPLADHTYEEIDDEDGDELDGYEKIDAISIPNANENNHEHTDNKDKNAEMLKNGITTNGNEDDEDEDDVDDKLYEELEIPENESPAVVLDEGEYESLHGDIDDTKESKPPPKRPSYADIEIIKGKKDKKISRNKSSSKIPKTNYTDVIIDTD